MTEEEIRKQSDFLINTSFLVALALDLMIRESERLLNSLTPAEGWQHESKKLFNLYTDYVRKACMLNEQISQIIYQVESKNDYKGVQAWQEEANELVRGILMLSDRMTDVNTVNKIHKFLRDQPGDGNSSEELLNRFYLK